MHYLLVTSENHILFSHYDLMEVKHIIKVDSSKRKCNVIKSLSAVRLRDHGVCACSYVLSVLLSNSR
jgi:hypothetical protein